MLPTMDIDVGSGAIMRIALCAVSNFQKIVNHTALRGLPLKKGNSLTTLGITQFAIVTHCRGLIWRLPTPHNSEHTYLESFRFLEGQAVHGTRMPNWVSSPSSSGGGNLEAE